MKADADMSPRFYSIGEVAGFEYPEERCQMEKILS